MTLFTVAEDLVQSGSNDVDIAVRVLRLDGSHGEALVEASSLTRRLWRVRLTRSAWAWLGVGAGDLDV